MLLLVLLLASVQCHSALAGSCRRFPAPANHAWHKTARVCRSAQCPTGRPGCGACPNDITLPPPPIAAAQDEEGMRRRATREVSFEAARRVRQECAHPAILHFYAWLLQGELRTSEIANIRAAAAIAVANVLACVCQHPCAFPASGPGPGDLGTGAPVPLEPYCTNASPRHAANDRHC